MAVLFILLERFSYDLKNGSGKCSLFNLVYQPMDETIRTQTVRFPATQNPNMEKALFD